MTRVAYIVDVAQQAPVGFTPWRRCGVFRSWRTVQRRIGWVGADRPRHAFADRGAFHIAGCLGSPCIWRITRVAVRREKGQ